MDPIPTRHIARAAALAAAAIAITALAIPPDADGSRPWRVLGRADGSLPWRAPVDGPVSRGFDLGSDPFEPGRHRGADFAAPPGTIVHAACTGRVLVAGRVGTSGRVVTLRCGQWRATHMPLATVTVREGETIRRGASIGTLAPSGDHAGLHLGARRDGSRFGYTDPLRLIGRDHRTPAPLPIRPTGRRPPRVVAALRPSPRTLPALRPLPPSAATRSARAGRVVSSPAVSPGSSPVAPWPAWAGLAALLAGAVGTGVRLRGRKRHARAPRAAAQEVP